MWTFIFFSQCIKLFVICSHFAIFFLAFFNVIYVFPLFISGAPTWHRVWHNATTNVQCTFFGELDRHVDWRQSNEENESFRSLHWGFRPTIEIDLETFCWNWNGTLFYVRRTFTCIFQSQMWNYKKMRIFFFILF